MRGQNGDTWPNQPIPGSQENGFDRLVPSCNGERVPMCTIISASSCPSYAFVVGTQRKGPEEALGIGNGKKMARLEQELDAQLQPTIDEDSCALDSSCEMETQESKWISSTTEAIAKADNSRQTRSEDLNTCEKSISRWQSSHDLPERRLMIQRIIALSDRKLGPFPRENVANTAKRIELSLYSRAGSRDEYLNLSTLRRRLHSVLYNSYHEASALHQGTKKRCHAEVSHKMSSSGAKRRRLDASYHRSAEYAGSIFPLLGDDTSRMVFAFLSGCEVWRLRSLNRYACAVLPTCIRSLKIEARLLSTAMSSHVSFFSQMPNLTRLTIWNGDSTAPVVSHEQPLHAWSCPNLDVAHDNMGEVVVVELASEIQKGYLSRLRSLQLISVFTSTSHRNGIGLLCDALSKGRCADVEDLLLGGNSISDAGACAVAAMLTTQALPKLTRLDLRRSFIGEVGLRHLMSSLSTAYYSQLKFLCMGGNLITDKCVGSIKAMLNTASCPHMRFLGLEDNFLSAQGIQQIIDAASAAGMTPKLHRVSAQSTDSNV